MVTTSYDNPGGRGQRKTLITVTGSFTPGGGQLENVVDGVPLTDTPNNDNSFNANIPDITGLDIKFDFRVPKIIDEVEFYSSFKSINMGTWQWQGSNNDADWANIGLPFQLTGEDEDYIPQVITELSGNSTAYRYYRILGVSGKWGTVPRALEFHFKISEPLDYHDWQIVNYATVTDTMQGVLPFTPTPGNIVVIFINRSSNIRPTINTDEGWVEFYTRNGNGLSGGHGLAAREWLVDDSNDYEPATITTSGRSGIIFELSGGDINDLFASAILDSYYNGNVSNIDPNPYWEMTGLLITGTYPRSTSGVPDLGDPDLIYYYGSVQGNVSGYRNITPYSPPYDPVYTGNSTSHGPLFRLYLSRGTLPLLSCERIHDENLSSTSINWRNHTVRQRIAASYFTASGDYLHIGIKADDGSPLTVTRVTIGYKGDTGDFDFEHIPEEVTFNGGLSGFAALADEVVISDPIAIEIDGTRDIIVSFHIINDTSLDGIAFSTGDYGGAFTRSYKDGGDDTNSVVASGYSTSGSSSTFLAVIDVCVADVPSPASPTSPGPASPASPVSPLSPVSPPSPATSPSSPAASPASPTLSPALSPASPASPASPVADPDARVTQLPIIIAYAPTTSANRLTQLPIMMLAQARQPNRVTQVPVLPAYLPKPIPVPMPIIPEVPVAETWAWKTVISILGDGKEQRSGLRGEPRHGLSFNVVIQNETHRREMYQALWKFTTREFPYPFYQYSTKLTAKANVGTTVLKFDLTQTDIRDGEKIALVSPDMETTLYYDIASVQGDGVTLSTPLLVTVDRTWLIAPVTYFLLKGGSGFNMRAIGGGARLEMSASRPRQFQRPGNAAALIEYRNIPVLYQRPLADNSVTEEFDANADILDNDTSLPQTVSWWSNPFISGKREFIVKRPADLDYWRKFCDYCNGMQNPFLMPTFRNDIGLIEKPDLAAKFLLTGDIQYFDWWLTPSHKHVRIETANGFIYRTIDEVTANYDDNGDAKSLNIELDTPIGSNFGDNDIRAISFMNLCRLDSDTVTLTHNQLNSIIAFEIRTINA